MIKAVTEALGWVVAIILLIVLIFAVWQGSSTEHKTLRIEHLPGVIEKGVHYTGHIRGTAAADRLVVTYSDRLGVSRQGRTLHVTRAQSGPVFIRVYALHNHHLDAEAVWHGVAR